MNTSAAVLQDSVVVGTSARMHAVFEFLRVIGTSESTVLVTGESGTGKEVTATLIHQASRRKHRPFVAVSCALFTETLIESELFGHERGAFTGAIKDRPGRFEMAEGGTIFLDDIDDVPLSMQVKLLRVLQNRTVERLGGTRTVPVNVRVIAGTKRDLKQMVAEGKFREDLYYRLRKSGQRPNSQQVCRSSLRPCACPHPIGILRPGSLAACAQQRGMRQVSRRQQHRVRGVAGPPRHSQLVEQQEPGEPGEPAGDMRRMPRWPVRRVPGQPSFRVAEERRSITARRARPVTTPWQGNCCHRRPSRNSARTVMERRRVAPRSERAKNARAMYEGLNAVRDQLKLASALIKKVEDKQRRADLMNDYEQATVPMTRAINAGHKFVYAELDEYSP